MAVTAQKAMEPTPEETAGLLHRDLGAIIEAARKMVASDFAAYEAKSVEDLHDAAQIGRTILDGLCRAIQAGAADDAVERASEFSAHVNDNLNEERLLRDLDAVIDEATSEREDLEGNRRRAMTMLIQSTKSTLKQVRDLPLRAEALMHETRAWAVATRERNIQMARNDATDGITTALQTISRQISFIGTNLGAAESSGTPGAGRFKSVSEQLMASLDALSLPRNGVQFARGEASAAASDALINGLLDAYRPRREAGKTFYEPGRSEGRAPLLAAPGQLLGGAARVAARQVRDEADIILDILDRLPDMTRFETRAGVPKLQATSERVARHFADLHEVMADPQGVNLPRAMSTIRRAVKATGDFFDYANLEQEFFDQMEDCDLEDLLSGEPRPMDEDEVGQRRPVVKAEEIRAEIRELCDAFRRLRADVERPLDDTLGRTAARLELQLAALYHSAQDMRAIFRRHGTSLPEQDLLFFTNELCTSVEAGSQQRHDGRHRKIEISIGQLLDWIIEVAKPHANASHLIGALEALDLQILSEELGHQKTATCKLIEAAEGLGFAIRLAGPMRQLEELHSLLGSAAKSAATLADATSPKEG
ncbi:hypothetical protein ACFSUD_11950 [Sulfitobacter aestuarii]|uniref:Methyl-accepting chemotaxis protein n=1 Tax=Sulfitobacter aestuarii TaxID=2161676 RepID=A0ABW5U3B4_9RHOB